MGSTRRGLRIRAHHVDSPGDHTLRIVGIEILDASGLRRHALSPARRWQWVKVICSNAECRFVALMREDVVIAPLIEALREG